MRARQRNNVSSQNVIITSKNYTLTDDYYYRVNLPYTLNIPSIGKSFIMLQKVYFSSSDMIPDPSTDTEMLFVYASGEIGLYNNVIVEGPDGSGLIGTVPVLETGKQFYENNDDSAIIQELYDNQNINSFTLYILNDKGVPVKFSDNTKPIFQFSIRTDYEESALNPADPQLLVSRLYNK